MNNGSKGRNAWVEHHFRIALCTPDGCARSADICKAFLDNLPYEDRKHIERFFGPDSDTIAATPDDFIFLASGRLEEIEERFMKAHGLVNWQ